MNNFILVGRVPVAEPDILAWSSWFEKADGRVARDVIGDVEVSTVFLGIDHSWDDEGHLLFETMIFGGKYDEDQDRCATWEEAEAMHARACDRVRGAA